MRFNLTLDAFVSELALAGTLGRKEAMRALKDGKLDSVQFSANVFIQGPNKNHVRLPDDELSAFAASFAGQPFLFDHAREQAFRKGTIRESELIEKNGKKVIRQTIEATKPDAIEGVLDQTIDRFSIGWSSESYECTVCKCGYGEGACGHDYWDIGHKDSKSGEVVEVICHGIEGAETSAVTHPAVPGTSVESALKQLSEFRRTSGNSARAEAVREFAMKEKILALLGLKADSAEPEALAALEARLAKTNIPKALYAAAGVQESVTDDALIAAVASLTAPGNLVAKAEHDKVVAELAGMKADDLVRVATAKGKIAPSMATWAREFALRDPKGFESYIAAAPIQVPLHSQPPPFDTKPDPNAGDVNGLTPEELHLAKKTGMSPAEFAKEKKAVLEYDARLSSLSN